MAVILSNLPNGRKTYLDGDGKPLSGGQVTFYVPGTTDLTTTWQDDAQTIVNTNPVILDSAGTCVAFAVGAFREYVQDSLGNLISDSVAVASTPLTVSAAMLPVLEAATVAQAEAILATSGGGLTHLDIAAGDQSLNVSPTGNPPATRSTLNVQGATSNPNSREFLANFGMTSVDGLGGVPGNDKVTLYSGMEASLGTSDVWSLNTVLTQDGGSGSYNAQCYELDLNNNNAHRGNSGNLITDFTAPVSMGMAISGAGSFSSTTGILINSPSTTAQPAKWNRGLTLTGKMGLCGINEWSIAPVGMQFDGGYSIAAINLTSLYGNAGAVADTALLLKNNQRISWQSAARDVVISDYVDNANNRVIGLASSPGQTPGTVLCSTTIPLLHQTFDLGNSDHRWRNLWIDGIQLINGGVLVWNNNPANQGGVVQTIFDTVDTNNNRVVGINAAGCYSGAPFLPLIAGHNLGSTSNPWGIVYSSGGIADPSDIALKENVTELGSMLDVIEAVEPISFTWKDGRDDRLHYGFNADHVRDEFPDDFAGYHEKDDGSKWLKKDELIAALWQGNREMIEMIRDLSARLKALEAL